MPFLLACWETDRGMVHAEPTPDRRMCVCVRACKTVDRAPENHNCTNSHHIIRHSIPRQPGRSSGLNHSTPLSTRIVTECNGIDYVVKPCHPLLRDTYITQTTREVTCHSTGPPIVIGRTICTHRQNSRYQAIIKYTDRNPNRHARESIIVVKPSI